VVLAIVLALAVALVAGVVVASCSGGGHEGATKAAEPTTTTVGEASVDIPLGNVSVASAGPAATLSADQSQRVVDALTTYVKGASVQPLRTGKPATADFSGVFAPATLVTATTTDRAVLLDEGLPVVTGKLTVKAGPVTLTGLADQSGNVVLVSANLVTDTTGVTAVKGSPLHVLRQADLTLQPDPAGTWKITAYGVLVKREGAGLPGTSGATASSTPATTGAAR
jgi:hypothetical protein